MTQFIMEARENYDPANVALLAASTPQNQTPTDQTNPACGFDFTRRNIMYVGLVVPGVTVGSPSTFLNPTSYTLFDGFTNFYAPGASINPGYNFSPQVMQKNIQTDAVTAYQTYSSSATVPVNVGCIWPSINSVGSGNVSSTNSMPVTVSGGGGSGMEMVLLLDAGGSGEAVDVKVSKWGTGYTSAPTASVANQAISGIISFFSFESPAPLSLQPYIAVTTDGQVWIPTAWVDSDTAPYNGGKGYIVQFHNAATGPFGPPVDDIGTVAATFVLQNANPPGGNPDIIVTNFGVDSTLTTNLTYDGNNFWTLQVNQNVVISPGSGTAPTIYLSPFHTPSDGAYRWIGADYSYALSVPNAPNLVNPHSGPNNGDFWVHAESCELNQYQRSNGFIQTMAPASIASGSAPSFNPLLIPLGIDKTWCYATTAFFGPSLIDNFAFVLVPAAITPDETTAAAKLPYVIWGTNPFSKDLGLRMTFGTDGNPYCFSMYSSTGTYGGAFRYRLTQFKPPALGVYGSNLPGTMKDVTPWSTSQGPDLDGAGYTIANANAPQYTQYFSLFRLPENGQMAAICKFPYQYATGGSDYSYTLFSCCYISLGDTPTFDYHSGFVTGYMNSSWVSVGSIPTTGFAVVDCRETNNYMEQSDFVYSGNGLDYTKRWLVFQCYPITAGAVDTSNGLMTVLAQYQFISGSPPALLQFYIDADWDVNYTAYQTAISQTYVVNYSMMNGVSYDSSVGVNFGETTYLDPGLWDDVTQTFWFSGLTNSAATSVDHANYNYMFNLDPAFSSRIAYNNVGTPQHKLGGVTPPFLRLSFAPGSPLGELYCIPFCVGATYCSEGQILRPVTPQETMTQSGPSLGKYRRMTDAMPLFYATQGVSMGVDFYKMRPLNFTSPGGTTPLTIQQTFSGVYKGQVDAQENLDNLWCWEVCRPYPCTLVAVACQLVTNENL